MGKTFTDVYRFKRLLQTEPSVLRLYKKQEQAINSIPAVKDIAIYEDDEPLWIPSSDPISPSDTAPITLLHRGNAEWPRRVMFAEQIPDLYEQHKDVWSVNLKVTGGLAGLGDKSYEVQMKHFSFPIIINLRRDVLNIQEYLKVDEQLLPRIDGNEKMWFYLIGYDDRKQEDGVTYDEPWEVRMCGVCPDSVTPFNATFYDRDVAHLYADSLRVEIQRLHEIRFKNKLRT